MAESSGSMMDLDEGDEDKEYRRAYSKALEKGKAKNNRIPIMLVGQDRGGKTSLMGRLLGLPFNKDQPSTIGIDVNVIELTEQNAREPWVKREVKDFMTSEGEADTMKYKKAEISTPHNQKDVLRVSLTDFAGKSIYYDTHGCFVKSHSPYVLVHDLSLEFDEPAVPRFKGRKRKSEEEEEMNNPYGFTNLDKFVSWLKFLRGLGEYQDEDFFDKSGPYITANGEEFDLPLVLIAFTHCDKVEDNYINYVQRRIQKVLSAGRYNVFPEFFLINNTLEGDEGDDIRKLRRKLFDLSNAVLKQEKPISIKWLNFEVALSKKLSAGYKYISVDEAKKVAEDCDVQVFDQAIKFLHRLGTVVYHSGSSKVVLDPLWLMNLFTKVISIPTPEKVPPVDMHANDVFKKKGILFQGYLKKKAPLKHAEILEELMKKFNLISPGQYEGQTAFYVPSVAPFMMSGEQLEASTIPSLFVTFPRQLVPMSLFTKLQVRIISEWKQRFPKQQATPSFYCNYSLIPLILDGNVYGVRLIDLHEFIKVTVFPKQDGNHSTFVRHFLAILKKCLDDLKSPDQLLFSMTSYDFEVKCTCCFGKQESECSRHHKIQCDSDRCGHRHFWKLSKLQRLYKDEVPAVCKPLCEVFDIKSVQIWLGTVPDAPMVEGSLQCGLPDENLGETSCSGLQSSNLKRPMNDTPEKLPKKLRKKSPLPVKMCRSCSYKNKTQLSSDRDEWPIDKIDYACFERICCRLDVYPSKVSLMRALGGFDQLTADGIKTKYKNGLGIAKEALRKWGSRDEKNNVGALKKIIHTMQRVDVFDEIQKWEGMSVCHGCGIELTDTISSQEPQKKKKKQNRQLLSSKRIRVGNKSSPPVKKYTISPQEPEKKRMEANRQGTSKMLPDAPMVEGSSRLGASSLVPDEPMVVEGSSQFGASSSGKRCIESEEEKIRTLANEFVKANPSCIAAVPYHTASSGAETTPDFVVCLYIHTSVMRITDNFREEATKIFFPSTVQFVDLERDLLGESFWPHDHEEQNDAEEMAKMAKSIVKNLSVFKNRLNVTAVYPSYKISSGLETNDLCVTVAVLGKGKIPVGEKIFPESLKLDDDMYKIDIVEGYFVPAGLEYSEEELPLSFGAGIGVRGARGTGTLGAFVTDEKDCFVLSCSHVLFKPDEDESGAEEQGVKKESAVIKFLLCDVANHLQELEKKTTDQGDLKESRESGKKRGRDMSSVRIVVDKIPDEKPAEEKSSSKSSCEEKPNNRKFDANKSLTDYERRLQQLEKNHNHQITEEDFKKLRYKICKIKGHLELEELVDKMKKKLEANGDCAQNEDKMRSQVKAPRRGEILIEQPAAEDYVMQVIDLEQKRDEAKEKVSEQENEMAQLENRIDALKLDQQSGRENEEQRISKLKKQKHVRKQIHDNEEKIFQDCVSKLKELREDKLPRCIATYRMGFQENYDCSSLGSRFFVDAGIAKLSDDERNFIGLGEKNYDGMNYKDDNVMACSKMEEQAKKGKKFWKCGRTTGITKNASFYSMINVKLQERDEELVNNYGGFGHIRFGPICADCPKFEPHLEYSKSGTTVCYRCGKNIPTNQIKECNWALNCFMLKHNGEFVKAGDSGAVIYDEESGEAWAMVVGTFYRKPYCFTVTSSLQITLEALSKTFEKELRLCNRNKELKTDQAI